MLAAVLDKKEASGLPDEKLAFHACTDLEALSHESDDEENAEICRHRRSLGATCRGDRILHDPSVAEEAASDV